MKILVRLALVRVAAVAILLAGCSSPETAARLPGAALPESDASCAGSSAPGCRFLNSPVKLERTPVRLPRRPLLFYPTAEPLHFVDGSKRQWVAPRRTLTDGASIPKAFISIIGDPASQEFANAAAMHDAYCGVGNENGARFHSRDWRQVHRMFYDALRVGGTPERKAKVMYAAVYIGGPRWGERTGSGPSGRAQGVVSRGAAGDTADARYPGATAPPSNAGIPEPQQRRILRRTIGFIDAANPSLAQIDDFADGLIGAVRTQVSAQGGEKGADPAGTETAPGEVGDPAVGASDPAAGGPVGGTSGASEAAI